MVISYGADILESVVEAVLNPQLTVTPVLAGAPLAGGIVPSGRSWPVNRI